jgi:hypothetical protein
MSITRFNQIAERELNMTNKFREFLTESQYRNDGGVQHIYKFPNNFGASVIKTDYSYGGKSGLWELAVLDENEDITYHTPITQDVIGHLAWKNVEKFLAEIRDLESP